jgi:L-threonylcarbamoyladenylate synthase
VTDRLAATAEGIARAASLLAEGEVVAFPTDTVYGVGVATAHADRIAALFALKHRAPEKRIPILVSDLGQAIGAGGLADEAARRLTDLFWPGALSLVLPTADGETQAFRAPDHPVALDLIRAAGPLFTSSANRSGEPETLGADDVLIAFATQQDELAAVVDGGHVPGGIASTVLDLSVTPARILRVGPVTQEQIAEIVEVG